MNAKHSKTLAAVFSDPINGNLEWARIEALLVALGCNTYERGGSAVAFEKGGRVFMAHRPHPEKEAKRYRVKEVRAFLEEIGAKP